MSISHWGMFFGVMESYQDAFQPWIYHARYRPIEPELSVLWS